jgi:hypothetical protein
MASSQSLQLCMLCRNLQSFLHKASIIIKTHFQMKNLRTGRVVQLVERLPSKHEALISVPPKKRKERNQNEGSEALRLNDLQKVPQLVSFYSQPQSHPTFSSCFYHHLEMTSPSSPGPGKIPSLCLLTWMPPKQPLVSPFAG